jgi:uncharacterized protein YihD (DUF1040 family)
MNKDINRVNETLVKLQEYWLKHPYLRLGQIVYNSFITETKGKGDIFYFPDDSFVKGLEALEEKAKK